MKALIMAGGEGTRLRPLTCSLPKPMIDFLGKPLMQHSTELIHSYGINDICATVLFMGDAIRNHFGELTFFAENEPLGTAGSVKNAESFLKERFILLSGDALTDLDIDKAVAAHEASGAALTIILKRCENPLDYGIALMDGRNRITKFFEKPAWSEVFSDCVNTGMYIMEPEILKLIPSGKKYDFSNELFPELIKKGVPINGFIMEEYWCDIGNTDAYLMALMDALSGKVGIKPDAELKNGIYVQEGARISPSAILCAPAYIGAGTVIVSSARIGEGSVIGKNCYIGSGANIKRSYIGSGSYVSEYAKLSRAVLCGDNRIGSSAKLLENSVIGSSCSVGPSSTVMPKVRIWPKKWIEKGAVVRSNIVWGFGAKEKLFSSTGIFGEFGSELSGEDVLKAGAVFAALSGNSIFGHDGTREAEHLYNLFISGYIGAGKNAYCCGKTAEPILLAAKRHYGIERRAYFSSDSALISVLTPLSTQEAKKLNAALQNGEIPFSGSIGEKHSVLNTDDIYKKSLPVLPKGKSIQYSSGECGLLPYLEADKNSDAVFSAKAGTSGKSGCIFTAAYELAGDLLICAAYETAVFLFGQKLFRIDPETPSSALKLIKNLGTDYSFDAEDGIAERMLEDFACLAANVAKRLEIGQLSLGEYIEKLPKESTVRSEISCEWSDIGRVFSSLAALADEKAVLSHGIRFSDNSGSCFICAGEKKPSIRIRTEAASFEAAEELSISYSEKLRNILNSKKNE